MSGGLTGCKTSYVEIFSNAKLGSVHSFPMWQVIQLDPKWDHFVLFPCAMWSNWILFQVVQLDVTKEEEWKETARYKNILEQILEHIFVIHICLQDAK